MTRTVVITGSASGMGAATARRLEHEGVRVIGVDRRDADIEADLATPEGRRHAVDAITSRVDRLDGLATFAGLTGLTGRPGGLVVAVNYFGSVELLAALRPLLARGEHASALAISSNSASTAQQVPRAIVEACLAGDETRACELADAVASTSAYPASKIAVARWVRRHAPGPEWIGAGITLNALAPGATLTSMTAEVTADPVIGPALARYPIPLGRRADADELARVATFLLGPDARVFCGAVVFCDGGTDAQAQPDAWPTPVSWAGEA